VIPDRKIVSHRNRAYAFFAQNAIFYSVIMTDVMEETKKNL